MRMRPEDTHSIATFGPYKKEREAEASLVNWVKGLPRQPFDNS